MKKYMLSLFLKVDENNRRLILEMLDPYPKTKILDCGCSNCLFTRELAARLKTNDAYGVDFDTRSAINSEESGVEICTGNLNAGLPFRNESFDVIHANQVLEHLNGTDVFLKEVYRMLKPGGYAILSTPNLGSSHNLVSLFIGYQPFSSHISNEVILGNPLDPKQNMEHSSPGEIHLRIFTYRGLIDLLKHHGFCVEKIRGMGYYPFPGLIAGFLARIDPRHAVYLTVKVRKAEVKK
ncbi:class I SAM-dependent methyltransferase [Methanolacinia petrolearia]|nr:class I SAM-dependent methyltransferase [Methanolacinia petrolearia]